MYGTREVLGALYLRGLDRPFEVSKRLWPGVAACLRRSPETPPCVALQRAGYSAEAAIVGEASLMAQVRALLEKGAILTAECEAYPSRWIDLGSAAPPALWLQGEMPSTRFLGIVGSRQVDARVERFAFGCGLEATRLGFWVISGGAAGCDRAAVEGAGPNRVQLLATGFDRFFGWDGAGALLSLSPPSEEFSSGLAMERNALIYSASVATVIADARFKQGGGWHGGVEALRRKRCRVLVREISEMGSRALVALGAIPLASPDGLVEGLVGPSLQGSLALAG